MSEWEYYEHDGALFRKRADSGLPCVEEVYWPCVGWVRYTLDGVHRYMTSSRVNTEDALRECAAQDESLKLRAADAIAEGLRAIVGATAPPAPVYPRTITVIDGPRIMHLTPTEYDAWLVESRERDLKPKADAAKGKPTGFAEALKRHIEARGGPPKYTPAELREIIRNSPVLIDLNTAEGQQAFQILSAREPQKPKTS